MVDKTAILVVGMHRSGTSAITRTISFLGAGLPKDLVPANEGNPHGHWEPATFVELSDRMLADAGSDVYGIDEIAPDWFSTAGAARFVDEAQALVRDACEEDLIVLKDPRMALVLPVWEAALARQGYHTVHVLPLRHPNAVAESLRRRHLKTIPYDGWPRPRGETVWLRYTLAAVRGSRGRPRTFVDYAAFLADWRRAMVRVAEETGITWPRLGSGVEEDIDAFLHENPQAELPCPPASAPTVGELAELDLAGLAASLHRVLCESGDDRPRVDAIRDQYWARTHGIRDLISAFEGLYPLVWRYYEDATRLREIFGEGEDRESRPLTDVQRLWAALTRCNEQRGALRIDLSSAENHVRDLEQAIETDAARIRLERHLAEVGAQFEAERQILRTQKAEIEANALRLQVGAHHLETTIRGLRDERQRLDANNAALTREIESLRTSTSWRITQPIRALVRWARG